MNLSISYEFPNKYWAVTQVYEIVANYLKNKFKNSEIKDSLYLKPNNDPCNFYGPSMLTVVNKDNSKYLAVSYWDRAHELFFKECGWNPSLCKGILTSHGVFKHALDLSSKHNVPIVPISFCQYRPEFDKMALQSKPVEEKINNNLIFRGLLHADGYRDKLKYLLPEIILDTDKKLPYTEYYREIQDNKINLSLNGTAELSHRDIEILGSRSVLLRPILNQKFHNRLVNNVHYIGYEYGNTPEEHANNLVSKYKEIRHNNQLLKFVSENGYKWYKENGSIQKNAEIIIKKLDIKKLL